MRNLNWISHNHSALILIWVFFFPLTAASASGELPPDPPYLRFDPQPATEIIPVVEKFQERLLLVDINRQNLSQAVLVLEDNSGMLYLSSQDLQHWRVRLPATGNAIEYNGETFFPLAAISGVSHVYDQKKLTLIIEASSNAFTNSEMTTRYAGIPPPVNSGPGGFFNYDLLAADSPDSTQRAGQFEAGYFNRYGVGTSNVLADNLGRDTRLTRLDSTWTVDYPEKMRTLRMGDAINTSGSWGRSVGFGGIQYGTNFATQPGFLTFPPQSVAGQAVLPSTVDVFVNNSLISSQSVPPGPFSINNLPVVTGAGEVQLVVRDMLGREQLVTRPFYASQTLLREGLQSYSYELGFIRENFGINSNDYGNWLTSGTYRRGMNEHLTGEIHAEAMRELTTLGTGGDYLLAQLGTLSGYIAGSQSNTGQGGMLLLGVERQAQPWSLGLRAQWASSGFSQIGLQAPQLAPARLLSANLGYATRASGSVGIAYIEQLNRDLDDTRIGSVSYSVSLGKFAALSLSAMRNFSGDISTTAFALLSISLDQATSLSGSQMVRDGNNGITEETTAILQRNLPVGEGHGYRLLARSEGSQEAAYAYQNNIGTYSAAAAQTQGTTATMLNASGGLALLGGDVFMSRRIDQSFAVARIPDYPGVRILADNQPAGRTDTNGNALIPRLRAYDINNISIDQRDIPMDAEIGATRLVAIPYYRSGVEVKFPVKHSRGAIFTILLEDGKSLPLGASVQEIGKDEIYTVGYDGLVYVIGLASTTSLRATWHGQSCEFDVHFSASADPLPDLGTFICKGVKP